MKVVIGIVVGFLVSALLLTAYLGPDDLRSCDTTSAPTGVSPCQAADALVVVSGGDTNARVDEALKLYRSGWAPLLIFSGAAKDKMGPSNAAAMRTYATEQGIPESSILVEENSETTKQNAELTRTILSNHDISSVILVTSAYHQRRAGLEFKSRAGDMVQIRNHPVATETGWPMLWWLTPQGWYTAITELVKIIAFYAGQTQ